MAKATQEDARLLVELAKLSTQLGLPEAIGWLWSDAFIPDYEEFHKKYPSGTEEHRRANQMCGFYETVGALWKHGLISEELLFDWLWIGGPWERIKGFALGQRKEAGNPRIYELFEAMAEAEKTAEARVPVGAGRN